MARLKSRFVRALVETVQQETAGAALSRLRSGLSSHCLRVLGQEVLGTTERNASVELDTGLELLMAIDRVLCGGSGVVMARAMGALASRVLSQSSGLVVAGDTVATLQHLRAPFEHPFLDVELHYSARRNPDGFVLELELPGCPRAVSWLSAAGLGYARAAAKFSGQGSKRVVRFDTQQQGDVARILARKTETGPLTTSSSSAPPGAASSERSQKAPRHRSSATNAAARVDAILGRAAAVSGATRSAEERRSTRPEPRGSAGPETPRAPSGVRPTIREPEPRVRKSAS